VIDDVQTLTRQLKSALEALYGRRLRAVYLYGSWARGAAGRDSDVDVLVVLDDFESYAAEVDRTAALVAETSLRHGLSVSLVFVRERHWLEQDSPFLANVREEAIPA
jgi:predicted nucleotidyltransferase